MLNTHWLDRILSMNDENPFFSIIVPVYNVETYLRATVESLQKQTFGDIEILLVDDGSTDKSKEICMELESGDERIRLISHGENKSLFQARKTGVENAKGRYIVFLDGDDAFDLNAMRLLHSEIEPHPADLTLFGLEVIDVSGMFKEDDSWKRVYEPWPGELDGSGLVFDCFVDKKFCWSMCGKVFNTELMKKAYSHMGGAYINMCEDLYQCFVILHFAQSYRGTSYKNLYKYYFGRGMSAAGTGGMKEYKQACEEKIIINSIDDFLAKIDGIEKYKKAYEIIYRNVVYTIADAWVKLAEEDRRVKMPDLIGMFDAEDIVWALSEIADAANKGATQAHDYREALKEMRESESYKIGLKVTALPRAIKRGMKRKTDGE